MAPAIEVFVGETTGVQAHVYAEYRAAADEDSAKGDRRVTLSGRLVGPECASARTLPAELAFRDLGPGPTALAEALVPDPCCWSPALPHLYNVEVEARQAGQVIARYEGCFGIRRLSARGRSLVLDGQRWVVRGATYSSEADLSRDGWHAMRHCLLVADPEEELCRVASRVGVPLVAALSADEGYGDELTAALYRVARWPAVVIAVVPTAVGQCRPRNLLLAEWFGVAEAVQPADWADAVVCEVVNADEAAQRLAGCELPVIAVRSGGPYESLAEISAACDRLQRDLAPRLDLAGYVV